MRDGYIARWKGVEYDSSPDGMHVRLYSPTPGEGFVQIEENRYRRGLPLEELDDFFYVRTTARWRGESFYVLGENGNWMRLEYTGNDPNAVGILGLETYDVGVYQVWAPREEITDIAEEYI
ncbi:hypothetical protein [Haloglycomyces albus]|uniref:hypothetical protein n=1 Tax=Haloglycomyces albus TaxID=526067 RepID=UPI00046CB58A|nr:hypothetical protein [Haloglycomyces albus]